MPAPEARRPIGSPSTPPRRSAATAARRLRIATGLVFTYMCCGELLPRAARQRTIAASWDVQQLMLLSVLCVFIFTLSIIPQREIHGGGGLASASPFLFLLNACPLTVAAVVTLWSPQSDNCPTKLDGPCDAFAILSDTIGLAAARLARLNLGVSLVLSSRGVSSWLIGASASQLGVAESIPLHRVAGWWCVFQSVLHSVSYFLFYLETGGAQSLWLNCFPAAYSDADLARGNLTRVDYPLNTMGLVNMFGVVAFLASVILSMPAIPCVRRRCYHVFQRTHLPVAALFILCCALHDLPILLFALPGLSPGLVSWLTERYQRSDYCWFCCRCRPRQNRCWCKKKSFPAKARMLPGTSGWVELVVDCGEAGKSATSSLLGLAPRGQWISVCIEPLGPESHPLSLTTRKASLSSSSAETNEMTAIVSSRAGDWSRKLAALAQGHDSKSNETPNFNVQVEGPFPFGGGAWSLDASLKGRDEPALLLLAGGTGVTG